MEKGDMTVPCENGFINIRVGAIIIRDGAVLMVGNDCMEYYYSVGGRMKFGETAEQAVIREVKEETGTEMEIDHLGFVHENYYYGDTPGKEGKLIYELAFFFYMKVPEDFEPKCESIGEGNREEFLHWVRPDEPAKIFPDFFRTEIFKEDAGVRHILSDER